MAMINSVLGPIRTEDLGCTLMHEHLIVLDWTMRVTYSDWFNEEEVFKINCNELQLAKDWGVKTFVDGSAVNMGRDPEHMKRVADALEMNIIASAGFYHQNEFWQMNKDPGAIAKLIIRDLEKGMNGTNIKAGIIKCGIDEDGLSEQIQMVLKSIAIAHKETGAPIYAHTVPDDDKGLALQEFLIDRGVAPEKLIIGHRADNWMDSYEKEMADCQTILKRGSYIGLDRLGDYIRNPLERRARNAADLIKQGWTDKMFFSHDFTGYCDWRPFGWQEMKDFPVEKQQMGMWQMFSLGFIFDTFIPELKKLGVTQKQIDTIMIDNPRRFFE